jgi:ubiquinone/menaquinone biosynthesis C-methylase UbiE
VKKLRYVKRLRSFFRPETSAVSIEERFWDEYVLRLRARPHRQFGPYVVGSEWGHEDAFLNILQRYGDAEKRALEIGCGGGRITAVGAKVFAHVYATDLSKEMLRECQTAITAPNVSFLKLDGMTLSAFADASIDLVYSHDVFVQLSSVQIYLYLLEIRRVLATGGIGVISCYDFVTQFALFHEYSLRCWRRRRLADRRLHFVTEEMLRAMLDHAGCEVVEVEKGRFLIVVFRKG